MLEQFAQLLHFLTYHHDLVNHLYLFPLNKVLLQLLKYQCGQHHIWLILQSAKNSKVLLEHLDYFYYHVQVNHQHHIPKYEHYLIHRLMLSALLHKQSQPLVLITWQQLLCVARKLYFYDQLYQVNHMSYCPKHKVFHLNP